MHTLLLAVAALQQGSAPVDLDRAATYFQELKAVADLDAGRLWGRRVDGPFMFVDLTTRTAIANSPDPQGLLKKEGDVYTGTVPANKLVANAVLDFGGLLYATVVWPPPSDRLERINLMVHESFHRIQPELKFVREEKPCAHLETVDGRYLMQLEFRALAKALRSTGEARRSALADALAFRSSRYGAAAGSEEAETLLERLEGVPSYTGVVLRGTTPEETRAFAAQKLEASVLTMPNLARGFPYLTGPAYGMLLDDAGARWRPSAHRMQNFGRALAVAAGLDWQAITPKQAEGAARRHGGPEILAAEKKREEEYRKRVAGYEKLLIDGPVLKLPMEGWRASFLTTHMLQMGAKGIVYTKLTGTAAWGKITVDSAVLVAADRSGAFVALPAKTSAGVVEGEGWRIELNEGWKVVDGARKGDLTLQKSSSEERPLATPPVR